MDFDTFLNQAWTEHAEQAEAVAERVATQGLALLQQPAQVLPLAQLAQHVHGAHLGRWAQGVAFQQQLAALPLTAGDSATAAALQRFAAALKLAGGLGDERAGLGASERIRITALAAAALAEHDSARARALLEEAVAAAEAAALPGADPALRALAATGNNMAVTLEEKTGRSAAERELMLLAAQTARRYWARAGTWLETERAEYRLAMSWLQAGDAVQARLHARLCLDLVQANDGPALERFFAWEALGAVARTAGHPADHTAALEQCRLAFAALAEEDRGSCQASLDKLAGVTPGPAGAA